MTPAQFADLAAVTASRDELAGLLRRWERADEWSDVLEFQEWDCVQNRSDIMGSTRAALAALDGPKVAK